MDTPCEIRYHTYGPNEAIVVSNHDSVRGHMMVVPSTTGGLHYMTSHSLNACPSAQSWEGR